MEKAAKAAFEHLHQKGGYTPADLATEKPYAELIAQTAKVFDGAIQDGKVPATLTGYLERDSHIFSGLKANAQLMEARALLKDENGGPRPYKDFEREVLKLNATYNKNYLEAEYLFATQSAQMAARWAAIEASGDRYDLQYRTASDDRVRATHRALHNITLPKTDPFWSSYFPPNGWRCRCTATEVRKGKNSPTDPATAAAAGEKATTQIDKNGNNKLGIFRFNPGKEKVVMPPAHPYTKVEGAKEAKKVVETTAPPAVPGLDLSKLVKDKAGKTEATNAEAKAVLAEYAKLFPDDFSGGLDNVKFSKSTSYLMKHTRTYIPGTGKYTSGTTLSVSTHTFSTIDFNPAAEFNGALLNIRSGKGLSFKQEYAVESMWHEILHAKTKSPPYGRMSPAETRSMETLNQFTARHTYDQFLERLGGKAAHKEAILEKGYGYGSWITEFRDKLKTNGVSEEKALADLQPTLLEDYTKIHAKMTDYLKNPPKKE